MELTWRACRKKASRSQILKKISSLEIFHLTTPSSADLLPCVKNKSFSAFTMKNAEEKKKRFKNLLLSSWQNSHFPNHFNVWEKWMKFPMENLLRLRKGNSFVAIFLAVFFSAKNEDEKKKKSFTIYFYLKHESNQPQIHKWNYMVQAFLMYARILCWFGEILNGVQMPPLREILEFRAFVSAFSSKVINKKLTIAIFVNSFAETWFILYSATYFIFLRYILTLLFLRFIFHSPRFVFF